MGPPPPLWARIVATLVGAAVLSLLAPPANWHWLHWVAYLPMFWALHPDTPRSNRWLTFLYGTVGVGLLFRWIEHTITVFSPGIPFVGSVAILGLFSVVFGLPYLLLWPMVHPMRKRLGVGWVVAIPALQVVIEWLSMYVLLFPYNHGVSQYRVPMTWQLVSVTGIWGLTWLVFFVNAALAEVMYRRREGRPFPVGVVSAAVATLSLVCLFGAWRYNRIEHELRVAPALRLAQLQSDKGMEYRMSHPSREGWEDWLRMSQSVPDDVDLIVWPEGACPYNLNDDPGISPVPRRVLADLAREKDAELIIGGGTRTREPDPEVGEERVSVFNSVYHFRRDGTVSAHYDKMVPLPFGEYLPFGQYFPDLAHALGIGDFRAGDVPLILEGDKARIAAPICYEAILPWVCRWFQDPELFVTVTNDAWFGDTANPHQHAMLAATRATELGVPMIRSAYTGISLVVEPHGVIHDETRPYAPVSRVVTVRLGGQETIYARFGDWFVGLCFVGLVAAAIAVRRQSA